MLDNLFFYVLLGMLIGARLVYVIIYDPSYYLGNPLDIFAVWKGGLSFHGGLIGIAVAALLFAKKNKISFYSIADAAVVPVPLCLALGRIGNFINGELYGRITSVPWAVYFSGVEGPRHPSQLYESVKNIIIFLIILYFFRKKLKQGVLFWLFVTLYPLFRFFVEFFRQPDEQLGFIVLNLSMGQLLSILMFVFGATMLYKTLRPVQK